MVSVPADAEAAILGPTSELVRRIEIFEADGVTRWDGGANDDYLIGGSVTIDQSRAERRSMELVLDNTDLNFQHSPDKFWYDKIIKVFCGVHYVDTTPTTSTKTRTNLWTNPSIETNTTGFTGQFINLSQSADWAAVGTKSLKLLPSSTSNDCHASITGDAGAVRAPLVAGKTYTVSGTVYIPVALTGSLHPTRVGKIIVHTKSPTINGGNYVETQSSAPAATGASRVKVTFTVPADATEAFIRLYNGATNSATNAVYWDAIQIEEGVTQGLYFDGASQAFANRTYAWTGTAHASTSVETTTIEHPTATPTTWETQVGEFMIDVISEDHFPYVVKVTGRDYAKKCLLSKFTQATAFAAGAAIETVIQSIASNAGITKFIIPPTGKTLAHEYFFERGTERWKAMFEIAKAYGYELFFDAQGYLVMREFQDPITAPLSYRLETGEYGTLVSFNKSLTDTRIYNHVIVSGESSGASLPVSAEAINTEPTSPTRVEKLGDRLYVYSSAFITTEAQALDVAMKFLKVMGLEEFDLNFSSIALPWLEVGEIVEFIDPRGYNGQPTRFLLSSLTLPLDLGAMSGNAKRVSVVG